MTSICGGDVCQVDGSGGGSGGGEEGVLILPLSMESTLAVAELSSLISYIIVLRSFITAFNSFISSITAYSCCWILALSCEQSKPKSNIKTICNMYTCI